jgi:diguanylate cyclase (GGDEF)-like protein
MISLKKYLDMDTLDFPIPQDCIDLEATECYCAVLSSIGKNANRIVPGIGADLEANLRGIGRRLSVDPTAKVLKHAASEVEVLLEEWGERTSEHFKSRTDEVKQLLIALAKVAESVGTRDQGYSSQFNELTSRLERIADLDDLTEIRSSLVNRVTELKDNVKQMARESEELVAHLKAEVSIYETKLKSAEHLAFRDELTLVANRRSIEERVRRNIENQQMFCVVMLDLNHFKQVNDQYGHLAGDDLLKQFAKELQLNTRSGDLVGRWGGDEFVVVLSSDSLGAQMHIDRIQQWVFGKYRIQGGPDSKPFEIRIDASLGVAEWHPGETMQQVFENADNAMYIEKNVSRKRPA